MEAFSRNIRVKHEKAKMIVFVSVSSLNRKANMSLEITGTNQCLSDIYLPTFSLSKIGPDRAHKNEIVDEVPNMSQFQQCERRCPP